MNRRKGTSKKDGAGTFLPYEVVYCTSEDPQHPISGMAGSTRESMQSEDSARGWQSAVNGKIPQTVVLRFPGNVFLQQIKLLSHEAKISTKVEVRVFALKDEALRNPPSFRAARFTKLGAVEFNSNEHTGFKSKERKTVHLQAEAYYLKLLFDRPYVNDLNMKQQVGIYSIECSGTLLVTASTAPVPAVVASSAQSSQANSQLASARGGERSKVVRTHVVPDGERAGPPVWQSANPEPPVPGAFIPAFFEEPPFMSSETAFRSVRIQQFEEFFIHRTEELLLLKEQAITVEDFETARLCRDKLNTMNVCSKRIYQLEQEKVKAIIEEDFETAEVVRDAMNELVETVYRDAQLPVPRPDFGDDNNSDFSRVPELVPRHDTAELAVRVPPTTTGAANRHTRETAADKDVVRTSSFEPPSAVGADPLSPMYADQRGEPSAATTNVDDEILPRLEHVSPLPTAGLLGAEKDLAEAILSLAGEPSDSVTPAAMPGADARLVSSVGTFTALCLFSPKFKLREAALVTLTEKMDTFFSESLAQVEESVLRFLDINGYGLQDNIPNVVAAACMFVRMVLADQHDVISSVVLQLLALLPRVLTRAADPQARVREEAILTLNLFVQTAAIPSSALVAAALTDPIDRERRTLPSSNARAQMARFAFMQSIVENDRFVAENARSVMSKLLIPGLNHQNAEVRDLATTILSTLILTKALIPTEAELKKISNPAIRDLLQGRRQSVI